MRAKEAFDATRARGISFTSAVPLSDEDVRENSKRNDFSHFSGIS